MYTQVLGRKEAVAASNNKLSFLYIYYWHPLQSEAKEKTLVDSG